MNVLCIAHQITASFIVVPSEARNLLFNPNENSSFLVACGASE